MSRDRSALAVVRNPVLALPEAQELLALQPEVRQVLARLLRAISLDARQRATKCLRTHKWPMALYWKCVAVYSGHIAKIFK